VDTVSPATYICEEVYEKFNVILPDSKSYPILLNNHLTTVHLPPRLSHFTELNVLGIGFLKTTGADFILKFNEGRESAFIHFNNDNYDKYEVQSQWQFIPEHIFQLEEISWPELNVGKVFGAFLIAVVSFVVFKKKPYLFFFYRYYNLILQI